VAKKEAAERKRKALASDQRVSSEGEGDEEEEVVTSDYDDSADELDSGDEEEDSGADRSGLKGQIVQFFKEASLDELSLISGCSLKKAQKVVELRPFGGWRNLVREGPWGWVGD